MDLLKILGCSFPQLYVRRRRFTKSLGMLISIHMKITASLIHTPLDYTQAINLVGQFIIAMLQIVQQILFTWKAYVATI